jgi:hypothetical protein
MGGRPGLLPFDDHFRVTLPCIAQRFHKTSSVVIAKGDAARERRAGVVRSMIEVAGSIIERDSYSGWF